MGKILVWFFKVFVLMKWHHKPDVCLRLANSCFWSALSQNAHLGRVGTILVLGCQSTVCGLREGLSCVSFAFPAINKDVNLSNGGRRLEAAKIKWDWYLTQTTFFNCFYSSGLGTSSHPLGHKTVITILIGINSVISSHHCIDFYGHLLSILQWNLKDDISSQ